PYTRGGEGPRAHELAVVAAASRGAATRARRGGRLSAGLPRRRPGPLALLSDAGGRPRQAFQRPLSRAVVRQGDLRRPPLLGQGARPLVLRRPGGRGGAPTSARGGRRFQRAPVGGARAD